MCPIKTILCGIFILGLLRLDPSNGRGNKLQVRFGTLNCTYSKEILQHFECYLKEGKGRNGIHVEWEFIKQVNHYNASLTASRPRRGNEKRLSFDMQLDGCVTMQRSYGEKVRIARIMQYGARYGNSVFPEQCPFEANKRYIVDKFFLQPEMFPSITPEMTVFSNFSFIVNKIAAFSVLTLVEFIRN